MPTFLPYLGDIALRSSLILGAAFFVLRLLGRASASERHLVLLASLLVVAVMPVVLLLSPRISWTIPLPRQMEMTPTTVKAPLPNEDATQSVSTPLPAAFDQLAPGIRLTISDGVAILILAGIAVRLLISIRAATILWTIRLKAVAAPTDEALRERVKSLAGMTTLPPILVSRQVTVPLLAGWLRPAIILPLRMLEESPEQLVIVLCHELAHLQRNDAMLLPGLSLIRAIYWWHPLVWLALARLRREREKACDDVVLNQNIRATDYAELIISTARLAQKKGWQKSALAMASPSNLSERIRAILNPALNRRHAQRSTFVAGFLMTFAFGWLVVSIDVRAADVTASNNPQASAANDAAAQVQLDFKCIEIDEKFYEANQKKIDELLNGGGLINYVDQQGLVAFINYANNSPGFSILSAPSVTTQDGMEANIDITHPVHYSSKWGKDKERKDVPLDDLTRDVGLTIESTPRISADQKAIDVHVEFKVTELQEWKTFPGGGTQPVFDVAHVKTQVLLQQQSGVISMVYYPKQYLPKHRVTLVVSAHIVAAQHSPTHTDQTLQKLYLDIYLKISDAEHLEKQGDYRGGLHDFKDCYTRLAEIHQSDPKWNTTLVVHRMDDCKTKIENLQPKADAQAPSASAPPSI